MEEVIISKALFYNLLKNLALEERKIIIGENSFSFNVCGEERYELEEILNIGFLPKKCLVSNKAKVVVVEFIYFDKWKLKIYQKNSRSDLFFIDFSLEEVGKYYYIFSSFENSFKLEKVENKYKKLLDKQEIFNKMLIISENDLKIFLEKKDLTSFERYQVSYSYKKNIVSSYDFYPERIDDGEQYELAISNNKKLESLKKLFENVAQKHGVIL